MPRGRQSGLYIAAAAALLGSYSLGVASTAAPSDKDEDAPRALAQIRMVRSTDPRIYSNIQQLENIDAILEQYRLTNDLRKMANKEKGI